MPLVLVAIAAAATMLLWGDRLGLPYLQGLDDSTPLRVIVGMQLAMFAVVLPLSTALGARGAEAVALTFAGVPAEVALSAATQGRVDWQTVVLARLLLGALAWAAMPVPASARAPTAARGGFAPGTRAAVGGALVAAPLLAVALLADAGVDAAWVGSVSPLAILDAEHPGRGLVFAGSCVLAWGALQRWRR